ncbi:zinc-binding dehydrogenase [Streptomyces sp. NPDC005648]|uniref:zinc-binding dehydrogenase n=1 Tax=Streptomyces sp. NPDC005648 TaxID=3157044 RepID=UPI0033B47064
MAGLRRAARSAGTIAPVIDRTYPLAEAAEAVRHLESGHPRGKLVVIVRDGNAVAAPAPVMNDLGP